MKQLLVPSMLPTFIMPIVEYTTGKDLSFKYDIVPGHLQDEAPEDQYTEYTSETVKQLGKFLKKSPVKIQNLIEGYTGKLGTWALKGSDEVLKGAGVVNPPEKPARERGLFGRTFTADSKDGSTFTVEQFYKELEQVEAWNKKNGVKGYPEPYLKFLRKSSDDMSTLRAMRRLAYTNPDLSPEDKSSYIEILNSGISDIARASMNKTPRDPANLDHVAAMIADYEAWEKAQRAENKAEAERRGLK